MKQKILALIGLISGSKGLKNKATKLLNGKPLIAHTILQAKQSKIFENMYKNMVINNDDYTDSRALQNPSILYICGGDVATTDYNTFFKQHSTFFF